MKQKNATFDHLNLSVRNFKESQKWYESVFGFETVEVGLTPAGHPWGVLRNGDSMLCIYEEETRKNAAESESDPIANQYHRIYHFGLRVTDRATWEETLASEKLKTYYDSPVRYPHSTSWYITDPSGHWIEVVHWKNGAVSFKHSEKTLKNSQGD